MRYAINAPEKSAKKPVKKGGAKAR